jgi:hypothetical protein
MTHHPQAPPKPVARILKWVAGMAAVLSLIFGLFQLWDRVFSFASRRKHVHELLATGRLQLEEHDLHAAWASDSEAALVASHDPEVRGAQEEVAMAWLDEALVGEKETFTALVDRLTPVLQRGLLDATGQRRADLLAHLGWADFLRSRDGAEERAPDSLYRQALAVDSQNAYAHAMLGHWIMWRSDDLDQARAHFAAAFAQGRVHAYVRRMQLAALANSHEDGAGDELIRVANDMRVHREPVDDRTRDTIAGVYYFRASDGDASLKRLLAAVPSAEHLKTFQWLFGADGGDSVSRRYVLGLLEEAAGERAAALRTMASLRQVPSLSPQLKAGADAALKRLGRPLPPQARDTARPR